MSARGCRRCSAVRHGNRHRRARSRVSRQRRDRQFEAASPPAGRGGLLVRSLPRLLRARRYRPHVAGGAVSLDTGRDSIRVGWCRARRTGDDRRRSERHPIRSDQGPGRALVVSTSFLEGLWAGGVAARTDPSDHARLPTQYRNLPVRMKICPSEMAGELSV